MMSSVDWNLELDDMLRKVEWQVTLSLRSIKIHIEQSGQPFFQAYHNYCLQCTIDRVKEVYSKFEGDDDIKMEIEDVSGQAVVEESQYFEIKEEMGDDTFFPPIDPISTNQLASAYESSLTSENDMLFKPDVTDDVIDNGLLMPESCMIEVNADAFSVRKSETTLKSSGGVGDISERQCNQCHRILATKQCLQRHMVIHTGEMPFSCNYCQKRFSLKGNLDRHIETHNKTKQKKAKKKSAVTSNSSSGVHDISERQCNLCQKVLATKHCLLRHMVTHTGEMPFSCNYCQKRFPLKGNLDRHIKIHTKHERCDSQFDDKTKKKSKVNSNSSSDVDDISERQCNECQKVLATKQCLQRHMVIHTGEMPYSCDYCERRFSLKGNLVRHLETHTEAKHNGFRCNHCNKKFSKKFALNYHMMDHQKDLFHCSVCFLGFSQKIEKMAHQNQCKQLRYECYLCNRVKDKKPYITYLKASLRLHMRTHSGERPYACEQCNKRFTQNCTLIKHMLIHTGEKPYACDRCGRLFVYKCYLDRHLQTHNNVVIRCSVCSRGFVQLHKKESHEKKCMMNRRYECYLCNSVEDKMKSAFTGRFQLEQHFRTHTGDKPFACEQCNKRFTQKSTLTQHMRIHMDDNPYRCSLCEWQFTSQQNLIRHMKVHEK